MFKYLITNKRIDGPQTYKEKKRASWLDVTGDVRVEAGSGVNKRHRKDLHIIYAPESRIYFFTYFTVFSAA